MNEDKNIDKLFKNKVSKSYIPEDTWNTPDDIVWDHIITAVRNDKKRKRRILIPLLFFCSISIVILLWMVNTTSINHKKKEEATIIDVALKKKRNIQNLPLKSTRKSSYIDTNHHRNAKTTLGDLEIKNNSIEIEHAKNNNKSLNKPHKRKSQKINQILLIKNSEQKDFLKDVSSINTNLYETKTPRNEYNSNDLPQHKFPLNKSDEEPVYKLPTSKYFITTEQEQINCSLNYSKTTTFITHPDRLWRWEMGISHFRYPINPFTTITEKDLQRNEYLKLISSKYSNLNAIISKNLSKHWSLSSGLYITYQSINAGFEIKDIIYQDNQFDDYLRSFPRRFYNQTQSPDKSNLAVVFLPDANVINGDTLQLTGQLPVQLQAFQIPLLVNYSYRKDKLIYGGSIGVSMDILKISIDQLPVKIYKDKTIVSEDIGFKPFYRTIIKPNIYLGLETKYFISKQINLGVAYKFEPLSPKFSRFEFGIYRRW